ncbi:hypothetical protein ACE5IS_18065 [Leptospira wolffii]|uniref:Uncharacterized protein n=1 Tax=Leptospira wolffii TaxID=409998 RepID=A0A2M9Z891_9LEPT|nr:hypothetical protein [Leptospira wolffii]EPG67764.1 hypothetical protein LEP1GSC061_0752 [Leptospira wolffii serovar Khorat str. Khorat-H2]PJZ64628.1 hypothetical protein CH371_17835 [Leptospira wolffii]TGK55126.1 hypothetical protein EHQ32_17995 [Leptospira wolffii]TGK67275.1 hypothetical protein EHQ27_15975 [Leptospira wolffii]TGK70573.1 hypothetical protein EHQ35_16515 [Leptospira wolffii]
MEEYCRPIRISERAHFVVDLCANCGHVHLHFENGSLKMDLQKLDDLHKTIQEAHSWILEEMAGFN